ncbi:MAG: hypothetical protein OPY03_01790 [Nitrosopumilus sp.]|nr:hypothetical protein [Nitrosopumilus sp.]
MKLGIRNSIPRWIVGVWITIGVMVFTATALWQMLEDYFICYGLLCIILDILMFFLHYLGMTLLVLGTFVLIGNEKQAQN